MNFWTLDQVQVFKQNGIQHFTQITGIVQFNVGTYLWTLTQDV